MAIKKDLTLTNNFGEDSNIPNSYTKVTKVTGNKDYINFDYCIYKEDTTTFLVKKSGVFTPSMESNFIEQAYEYLKTLDEYSDAVDC